MGVYMNILIAFPWDIFIFSIGVGVALIIYLYILAKKRENKIIKIMIVGNHEKLEYLKANYQLINNLTDTPDLIIDTSNDINSFKKILSLNVPIILISNLSETEIRELVKVAKYYNSTIIINASYETFEKDLERIKQGHIIKVYYQ